MHTIRAESPQKIAVEPEETPAKSMASSSENGCMKQSTARRLRQQRQAREGGASEGRIVTKSVRDLKAQPRTSAYCMLLNNLISADNSMTQRQSHGPTLNPSDRNDSFGATTDRSASRLRQPTVISKSPALMATLATIDQQTDQNE